VLNVSERRDRDDGDDPFDSTPLYALEDFVGGMFTKATNPAERWFEWGVPKIRISPSGSRRRVSVELHQPDLWRSIDPTHDNFYLNAPAWFGDMGMFGSGFMWQEEMVGEGRIVTPNLPLSQCFKDVDANGDLDTFHREFR
jgi:hypothetical protein